MIISLDFLGYLGRERESDSQADPRGLAACFGQHMMLPRGSEAYNISVRGDNNVFNSTRHNVATKFRCGR